MGARIRDPFEVPDGLRVVESCQLLVTHDLQSFVGAGLETHEREVFQGCLAPCGSPVRDATHLVQVPKGFGLDLLESLDGLAPASRVVVGHAEKVEVGLALRRRKTLGRDGLELLDSTFVLRVFQQRLRLDERFAWRYAIQRYLQGIDLLFEDDAPEGVGRQLQRFPKRSQAFRELFRARRKNQLVRLALQIESPAVPDVASKIVEINRFGKVFTKLLHESQGFRVLIVRFKGGNPGSERFERLAQALCFFFRFDASEERGDLRRNDEVGLSVALEQVDHRDPGVLSQVVMDRREMVVQQAERARRIRFGEVQIGREVVSGVVDLVLRHGQE